VIWRNRDVKDRRQQGLLLGFGNVIVYGLYAAQSGHADVSWPTPCSDPIKAFGIARQRLCTFDG